MHNFLFNTFSTFHLDDILGVSQMNLRPLPPASTFFRNTPSLLLLLFYLLHLNLFFRDETLYIFQKVVSFCLDMPMHHEDSYVYLALG